MIMDLSAQFERFHQEVLQLLPEEIQQPYRKPVVDWISGKFGIVAWAQVRASLVFQLSAEKILVEVYTTFEDRKYLLVVDQVQASDLFWFEGFIDAVHLSRSKKSVVVKTMELIYVSEEPFIDYCPWRYLVSLTGESRS
jgi:hypothetical protein